MNGWHKEITKWEDNTTNHSYYVNGDRLLKFKPSGSDVITEYSGKGLRFDKSRRKFIKLKGEKWND